MHIVCCIKQVPDTTQVRIDPDTNTLMRSGVESICNPYDLVATEAAVRLVEEHGGKVTAVSMGPPQARAALRQCLALGVAEAILLSDRAFAGADTLATSYALAQAVSIIAAADPVSLVLCGKVAIDGDTGQTGPGIAARLGYTLLTNVSEIVRLDSEHGTITVKRDVEDGVQVIEGKLPALLAVQLHLCTPRYASLPELVRSLRQEVATWDAGRIGAQPHRVGLKGSPTTVQAIFSPPVRTGGQVFDVARDGKKAVYQFMRAFLGEQQQKPPVATAAGRQ